MTMSCCNCKAVASPYLQLFCCAACKSAIYCSRACQSKDWKKHKQICKFLNVGYGGMQMRTDTHTSRAIEVKEGFENKQRNCDKDEDFKQIFQLFQESTLEGSLAVALEMMKIAERQSEQNQKFLAFHCVHFLVYSHNSEMLSWPNSPLLVLLQFVDPNVTSRGEDDAPLEEGEESHSLLHLCANLTDPSDYSTHENQLILAKQLLDKGANVNALTRPEGITPLHSACYAGNVTNLDFVELLLEAGADPNAQDYRGATPLMFTVPYAPSAAKFLLNWPNIDVIIVSRSGVSFLARVREAVKCLSKDFVGPDNPNKVRDQFLHKQWRVIEDMLMERGAHDTGISEME
jgi:hypothetical protein